MVHVRSPANCRCHSRRVCRWSVAIGLLIAGCDRAVRAPDTADRGAARFETVAPTAAAGVRTVPGTEAVPVTRITFQDQVLDEVHHDNGNSAGFGTILETLGGGAGIVDFDRDGWPDLLFPGGGRYSADTDDFTVGIPLILLRGAGGMVWSHVESASGLTRQCPYTHGCSAADFNNDGFVDLLVTGYRGVELFRNQGDGTFIECARASGLSDDGWSTAAAWGDFDGDGMLDLYLVRYVEWSLAAHRDCVQHMTNTSEICGPKHFPASDHRLFRNQGNGAFSDVTGAVGMVRGGKGLGIVVGDVDLDGDLDACVANDTTENFLYLNDGHGVFQEVGVLHGIAYDENGRVTGSMGIALADYDGDGLPDLWTTNFELETIGLYRNVGQGRFHSMSRPAGVAAIGDQFVGWGTAFADLDCDGDLDVAVSNGHLPGYPASGEIAQLPVLFVNDGHGRLHPARHGDGSYFSRPHGGRGLALGDLDRDGRLDLVLSNMDEAAAVLWNTSESGNHTLQVVLVGTTSNRDAIGARAVLETSAGSQIRQVVGGGSYLSQSELLLHWGYPDGAILKQLTIHWPSGIVETIGDLAHDVRLTVIESRSSSARSPEIQPLHPPR